MLAYHSCEAGVAATTGVTTANSATGGTAFDTVQSGILGGICEYSATRPRGALSIRCVTALLATTSFVMWSTALGGSYPTVRFRVVVRRVSGPSGMSFLRLRGGGSQTLRLTFVNTGELTVRNTSNNAVASSAGLIGASDWWLIRGVVTVGATGSATIYIHYDRTNPVPNETLVVASGNFGPSNVDEATFGVVGLSVIGGEIIVDDFLVTNSSVTPGPPKQSTATTGVVHAADAATRKVRLHRKPVGVLHASDVAARKVRLHRHCDDVQHVSDVAPRTLHMGRGASGTVEAVDSATRALRLARGAVGAVGVADVAAASTYYPAALWLGWAMGTLINGHYVSVDPITTGRLQARHPGDTIHETPSPTEIAGA